MTPLAHGGGAPEAAMIGAPLLLLTVFVVLERKARRREREAEGSTDETDEKGHQG